MKKKRRRLLRIKLNTKLDFEGNTKEGTQLNWHIEPFRIEASDDVWIHVINDENGEIVFEIQLSEWERIGKAIAIANEAEVKVEKLES